MKRKKHETISEETFELIYDHYYLTVFDKDKHKVLKNRIYQTDVC